MSDVFISHVEEDADVVLEIALDLEEAGYSTWCYEINSIPGPSYLIQTGKAIEGSKAVVVVISPHSVGSRQVTKEIVRAHESNKEFIPVLRGISHIEFQNRQPEWREALGAAVSIGIPREGVAGILPRIIDGLKALGIHPNSKIGAARIVQIRKTLGELQGRSILGKAAEFPASTRKPEPESIAAEIPATKAAEKARGRRRWVKPAVTACAIIAVIVVVLGIVSERPSPPSAPPVPLAPPAIPAPPAPLAPPAIPAAPALPALPGAAVGSISGYVKDAQGQAIVGASVYALVYTGGDKAGEKRWQAETDGGGHYKISNIPAGNYQVTAWAPKYVRMHWQDTLLRNNATPVSVTAHNDTGNINFKLEPGGTISGSVKDITTGKPLVNVSVTGEQIDGEGRGRTTTDQNGKYTISGLPFGQYKVRSPIGDGWGSGDDGYTTEYYNRKKDADSADLVTITVQNPDADGIHFGLAN